MDLNKADFGNDFVWGVSTAAYQIEGAHDADGKGRSIWDEFVQKRGSIYKGHHGREACDHYNNVAADTQLIRSLNIPHYRFSISWTRILPEGTGRISRKGIAFYNKLIDACIEKGITPWITLYHWDLPHSLEQEGGWTNRDIVRWFSNYVETCVHYFGDRVKHWIVLNEPVVFTGAGYFLGVHAPGRKGLKNFLAAVHHAALCQAEGGRIIKRLYPDSSVGTTFSCSHVAPYRDTKKDRVAAKKVDVLLNRLMIEPLLGLGYPVKDLPVLKRIEAFILPGDMAQLAFEMDFIGVQNYTREIVTYSKWMPFVKAKIIKANKRNVKTTLMNWEIYPEGIYEILKKFAAYPQVKELLVTENGAAFRDTAVQGTIPDERRVKFLQKYLEQVRRAQRDGVPVKGYFIWTLMDNFEWAEGYYPTFGLVHVDFTNQRRTIKASGYWYRDFLADDKHAGNAPGKRAVYEPSGQLHLEHQQ